MRFKLLPVFVLLLGVLCAPAYAGDFTAVCGNYSFEMPEGYEFREFSVSGAKFDKTLVLNQPFNPKDAGLAIVYCQRENKTDFSSFSLPHKERINLQTAPRRNIQLAISATEDMRHEDMWFKFSLLEERSVNSREIKDRERFMVAIEANAAGEDKHTMLFIGDFRKIDGFFDVEEYRSQVTNTAVMVLDSIKKLDF